jgi:hypothetical protein
MSPEPGQSIRLLNSQGQLLSGPPGNYSNVEHVDGEVLYFAQ